MRLAMVSTLVLLNIAILLLWLGVWNRESDLDAGLVRPEIGYVYTVPVSAGLLFPFVMRGDTLSAPKASTLLLTENGRKLGPAHALHADVRDGGGGAYSHWDGLLYFSTSDNSDPRVNQRRYRIAYSVVLHPGVAVLVWLTSAVLLLLNRKRLRGWIWKRSDRLLLGALAGSAVVLALVALGLLRPLNADAGAPKDWPLIGGIVLHLGIGVLLAGAVLATSTAVAVLVVRRDIDPFEAALTGYPVALAFAAGLAAIAIGLPGGRWLAASLLMASWVPLARWRPAAEDFAVLLGTVGRCAAPAAVYAAYMALLWHGPTATLSSSTMGDLLHSDASLHMLAVNPFPMWHLGSEGDLVPYQNMLPMAIGAALIGLPGFDGLLFLTASLSIFFALWLAIGLASVGRAIDADYGQMDNAAMAVTILLVVASVRTPSFIPESPPVALMVPLLFSISLLAFKARGALVPSVVNGIAAAVGTALSKVVLVIPLGLLALFDALVRLKRHPPKPWQIAVLTIVGLVLAMSIANTLAIWLPPYVSAFVPGPGTRIWLFIHEARDPFVLLPVMARDVGWCVLGIGVIRIGIARLTVAYWAAILACFFYPYLFDPAAIYAVLLVAIAVVMEPDRFSRAPRSLAIGASLLVVYPLTRDWAGLQAGAVWLITVAPIAWIALASAPPPASEARRIATRLSRSVAGLLAVGLFAVGSGLLVVDSGMRWGQADILTPAMYDMWSSVRTLTPRDALIFTDQTGPEFRVAKGWNSYAATGERQVFIASWVTSVRRFQIDPVARAQRLAQNKKVLSGKLQPSELPLARSYGAYFAVVRTDAMVPTNFEPIYRNEELALYRIKAGP
jgi:hypothetical protein